MNQKAYSILFCALLASTFIHEIRAKAAANPSFGAALLERAATPQQEICEIVCGDGSNSTVTVITGISIFTNINTSVLAVANLTAKVIFAIDIQENIIAVFNGTGGAAIVIDIRTNTGVYIRHGVYTGTGETSAKEFIASLNLRGLFKHSGAISFDVSKAETTILYVFNEVISVLIFNISAELKSNNKVGIQIAIAIASQLIIHLNGSLKGFLSILGTAIISTRFDLSQFLNFIQGFALIVGRFTGGLAGLIKAGIILDITTLTRLTRSRNGLEILINIILLFVGKIELLGNALGSVLNSVGGFFNLTAQLGGNGNVGVTGIFKVVGAIVSLIDGHGTIEIVINALILYMAHNGGTSSTELSAALNGTLSGVLEALKQVHATVVFSGLVKTLEALINGTLKHKNVNISAIILLLINSSGKPAIQVIISVILLLNTIVEIRRALGTCLFILILNISTSIGIQLLRALGIVITISISDIIRAIPGLLYLLIRDFSTFLTRIPGIGQICSVFAKALQDAGGPELKLVLSLDWIHNLLKGSIQVVFGIPLGMGSSIIAQVQAFQKAFLSVFGYLSINVSGNGGLNWSSTTNSSWTSSSNSSWSASSNSWSLTRIYTISA